MPRRLSQFVRLDVKSEAVARADWHAIPDGGRGRGVQTRGQDSPKPHDSKRQQWSGAVQSAPRSRTVSSFWIVVSA